MNGSGPKRTSSQDATLVLPLNTLRMQDVHVVGGKNASLGEMLSQLSDKGVRVPGGFATTAEAFRIFLKHNELGDFISETLKGLDVNDVRALHTAGSAIREKILHAEIQSDLKTQITEAFEQLTKEGGSSVSFAVRSSATAEDLVDASFAGQQETFLNVRGIDNVLIAIKRVYASLFNDRAISYRVHNGFGAHENVSISAGVQRMVRSDVGSSGVMFTLDTESGFDQVVFITSSYGLGETVVQGAVNPDEFYVYKRALEQGKPAILRRQLGTKAIKGVYADSMEVGKTILNTSVPEGDRNLFSLNDKEIEELARFALTIEKHYGRPMDIEWAKDGNDGKIYILQARPETVKARAKMGALKRYKLKGTSNILISGRAIGQRIGSGPVRVIKSAKEMDRVQIGDVLVTDMTDPDWEPVMKRASAIVTNRGGRTCHAAIIARELGIPAVVGCGNATEVLQDGSNVTVSCSEGDTGNVYAGKIETEVIDVDLGKLPKSKVKISMNVGNPELAFDFQRLPNEGIGLARIEFIIARMIGVHPRVVLDYNRLSPDLKAQVKEKTSGYSSPVDFYVQKLAEGVSTLCAAFWPKPVIVRLSDFKSNEYSSLLGGDTFEPNEENPMIGFRGASRYLADSFRDCFELECKALKYVRDEMGLTNLEVMVPFVRTLDEASGVIDLLSKNGLKRGENGLRVIMMCEIPANAILAEKFLEYFDGFSIGSNDMTQLTLALDRDSGIIAGAFDERDPAVKVMLHMAIQACRKANKYVGICGQGPSDHPDLAKWLMEEGIESISLNPDTVVDTWLFLAKEQP